MMKPLLASVMLTAVVGAQAPAVRPVIDNATVTVWDVGADAIAATGGARDHDAVVIYLLPESTQGRVDFVPQGGDVPAKVKGVP